MKRFDCSAQLEVQRCNSIQIVSLEFMQYITSSINLIRCRVHIPGVRIGPIKGIGISKIPSSLREQMPSVNIAETQNESYIPYTSF